MIDCPFYSYGVLGANISSQAMLFAKSGLELLLLTVVHHDNQFIYPLTWVILFALVFTAILQVNKQQIIQSLKALTVF